MTPEGYQQGGQLLRQIDATKQAVQFWKEELKTPREFVRKYQEAMPVADHNDLPRHYVPDAAMPTEDEFEGFKRVVLKRLEACLTRLETNFAEL